MPQATVGQRVQIDISGLQAPGVSVGSGVSASGTIIGISASTRLIKVRLDVAFSGQSIVDVPPERVTVIDEPTA